MSGAWSIYVIILTVITVGGSMWLLAVTSKSRQDKSDDNTTGHVWDGDLAEYNNPLPRWWLWLFIGTVVFSAGYLVVYPGFGNYEGTSGWSSEGALRAEQERYDEIARQSYARFADLSIAELAGKPEALALGRNIFANHCATCHGTDARGARGFPNLADGHWQWGGSAEQIQHSILHGRQAAMPGWGAVLGPEGTPQVVAYVRSLSGLSHNAAAAQAGKARYDQVCVACHGPEGHGNPLLGAPDLTVNAWIYGSSEEALTETLVKGRNGVMPAHGPLIGEDAVRMVAAYVYSLRGAGQVAQGGAER